jgi:hypothetical protein
MQEEYIHRSNLTIYFNILVLIFELLKIKKAEA